MVERVYGTTVIPSDQITVVGGGTIAISTAFAQDAGLVGGMDVENGTGESGEVYELRSVSRAVDLFGEDSELARAVRATISNGVQTVYAVGVPETEATEEDTDDSGTLENAPLFDPNVHPDHEISVTAGVETLDVRIVYDSPVSADADEDEVLINPITGEWAADESDTYEFVYTYGSYTEAINDVADRVPRILAVCTESNDIANELAETLNSNATEFDFTHGVVGAQPELDPTGFELLQDEPRLSVVAPARSFTDDAQTRQVRTAAAVGGHLASLPLGSSSTYDSLSGLTGLAETYSPNDAGSLIDAGVLPVMRDGRILVVKDMTTADDVRFERVYSNEIVDEATEISHLISQQFIGELNTQTNREDLLDSHDSAYLEMKNDRPPLLDNYSVDVNDTGGNVVELTIGLDVVNVIDNIEVQIVVGDVITNGGAE